MAASCALCGRHDLRPARREGLAGFVACGDCGFIFRPDLDTEELRDVYEGGEYEAREFAVDYANDAAAAVRARNARARLRWVLRHRTGGRLLDVGAAAGAFVAEAQAAGFQAGGVEPSPAFARYARERLGVDVRHTRLEDADLEPDAFEVITLWHVLEHIPRPVAALAQLREALTATGVLVVEVPNLASAMAARLGAGWVHLDATVHVNQFTPATLAAALARAGLEPVQLTTLAHGEALTVPERLHPRHLAYRAQLMRAGAPRATHPVRHELLRVAAQRAATKLA